MQVVFVAKTSQSRGPRSSTAQSNIEVFCWRLDGWTAGIKEIKEIKEIKSLKY